MKTTPRLWAAVSAIAIAAAAPAIDHPGIAGPELSPARFTLVRNGKPTVKILLETDATAAKIAAENLALDFERVTGSKVAAEDSSATQAVIVRVDQSQPSLAGKRETYEISFVRNPRAGVGEALVVTGSDARGAVYGIYELSEQLGVNPWYDWADAPLPKHRDLAIDRGVYTNGEPAVRYRGIFLNDEAPCLTGWVKNTYGTDFGDHRFYARVGELILRLRGNFIWPAMWCWAFYADDPLNSKTLSDMGVMVGTSHHEPMARNHQEWARRRSEYGAWNYATNRDVLDRFFAEGVRRMKGTEDVVTIGMRGDGDTEMEGNGNLELMRSIIASQRATIERETGRPAAETPQVWALYKEVQDYYDRGLRPPEDVTILLCDDNWGNVRRLPDAKERRHPGGWGMYYHVDYVGAPRNSKFVNATSAVSLWEQMSLAYEYGVDRLWILNVGDLKPMEYPITLFLDMAWNPAKYAPSTLHRFTEDFCGRLFGEAEAAEAARILDTTSRYACRVTAEMLDKDTYDLASGEWARVVGDYAKLAEDARRQHARLPESARAAYFELVLFHVEAMANLYEMYYSQAMNLSLGSVDLETAGKDDGRGAEINLWADRVEAAFERHGRLMADYNSLLGGKWNGFMRQKVIGYTSWSDGFPADTCPKVVRTGEAAERQRQAEAARELLAKPEPRIYSIQRSKSFDSNMGENWWMRRHEATLAMIRENPVYDLVLAGDSITHRWERHGKEAYACATNGLKVLNLGFGADNVLNLLWRFRSGELDGYVARAVQLMIGTNNSPSEDPEKTAAQIRAAVREIRQRQPQAKILLCAILPRGEPDSVERGKNHEVNRLLQRICDGTVVQWVDYSDFITLDDGRMDPALSDDKLHPNPKGYSAWAPISRAKWDEALGAPKALDKPGAAKRTQACRAAPRPAGGAATHIAIEAADCAEAVAPAGLRWEFLAGLGRTRGAMEVFPRLEPPVGSKLVYEVEVPEDAKSVDVTVVVRSTLAFARPEGHRYAVGFEGSEAKEVNFNSRLNEAKENIYSVYYPTVARRVVATRTRLKVPSGRAAGGKLRLVVKPLDQAIAFEKFVVSWGEYRPGYLFD